MLLTFQQRLLPSPEQFLFADRCCCNERFVMNTCYEQVDKTPHLDISTWLGLSCSFLNKATAAAKTSTGQEIKVVM